MAIKICGLTSLADALAAVEAGADYLGFNLYPGSPRCLAAEACARLVGGLARRGAAVKTVGVFVNKPPAEVAALLDACGLDLAQFHGDERPEQMSGLRGRAFKAVRDGGPDLAEDFDALANCSPGRPAFLFDAYAPGAFGGTGRTANWDRARGLAARYPIFLAGGLTPLNVAAAIAAVRPWGVDVASGVEIAPGQKDHARLRAFVAAAASAFEGFHP
ncbi:MAG: phosphoribosylanthranilate isomerase [Anaerolineales bacterium]|nr:phosphoribosylanthranilate isomerase [Anaerolineales bacterium]